MKSTAFLLAALALTACAPGVPDSNPEAQGVGFGDYDDYNTYRSTRDAELAGDPAASPSTPPARQPDMAATDNAPTGPAAPPVDTARVSDEQDFEAVSERETIQSDAERLYAAASSYEEVKPTPVPTRSGGSGANVVAYALKTSHPVGTKVYNRVTLFNKNKHARNCAGYASADLAQEDFLKNGGPEKDRMALDPDGDGYACGWNPEPYRSIAG